ncbi:ABC transporter permease [Streptosporangium saharense]|uniref:NitT/TauT family transport system permease protein n=1 Tax=Streptosporangium saharense TaxID=1706840 RepID=A0A7W7VP45_9ACTN|nr:ABC transporter permease subunit [Streptosporangium saharense]MBB4917562.1 NitT/TauT family transport system permease protein [Streptosporangium saharense]
MSSVLIIRRGNGTAARIAARAGTVLLVVALWWLATRVVFAGNAILSRMGPASAFAALVEQLGGHATLSAITASLRRLLLGLLLATVAGVPLGLLFGSRALVEYATAPVVQFLRMTSPLAWAPLVIVLLGSGDAPVVALVALAAVWPIVLGVSAGTRALDPGAVLVARSLGATRWEVVRSVVIPALAGPLRTALRVALGVAWVVLVPAEMFGVSQGLGYAVLNARDNLDYEGLAATMLLIGAIGFLLDRILSGNRTGSSS